MKINEVYTNNFMKVDIISIHTDNITTGTNNAIVRRINADNTTRDFVVVRNLTTDDTNNTCQWGYAYAYDLPSLTEATELFIPRAT